MTSEWQIATSTSRRRRSRKRAAPVLSDELRHPEGRMTVAEIEHSLEGIKASVRASDMLRQNQSRLRTLVEQHQDLQSVEALTVYGLGSLMRRQSRYQLAFILALLSEFPKISKKETHDPLYLDEDITVLESHGFSVLKDNDECRRALEVPSLIFMPHLDIPLIENFMASNISNVHLNKSIVICNNFSPEKHVLPHMVENTTIVNLLKQGRLKEKELIEGDFSIFYDLCIYYYVK